MEEMIDMKAFWLDIVIVLLLDVGNVHTEECKTKLEPNDRYSNLSDILECLYKQMKVMDERIKVLEEKERQKERTTEDISRKSSDSAAQIAESCGPSDAEGLFVVSLSQAKINGPKANATLTIVNTTPEPLFIAINDLMKPVLYDVDGGFSLQFVSADGIKGLHAIGSGGPDVRIENNNTRIPPNQGHTFWLSFSAEPKTTLGSQIKLNMEFACLTEGKVITRAASPCSRKNSR